MEEFYTKNEDETAGYAEKLAELLGAGSFIALNGELGAGKTVFVKGLARGLGVRERIVSPTFTLLRAYESGRLPLYHYDAYRISANGELLDTGFYEYAVADGVCVCEWASLIASELPQKRIDITIERVAGCGDSMRKITVGGLE